MRCAVLLAMILALAPGCALVFDGDSGGGDDVCLAGAPEPASLPAPQRNPETLTCDSFGGGCVPECGPCPAVAAELAPIPTWGFCNGACEALSETACAAEAGCRVVKDAACAVSGACPAFLGCFPTDQLTDPSIDCFAAPDGFTCSRSAACTAYHRATQLAIAQVERPFAMCAPEGVSPGSCAGQVVCTRVAPACPTGTTPGIASGCYTGACIPLDLCGSPIPPK